MRSRTAATFATCSLLLFFQNCGSPFHATPAGAPSSQAIPGDNSQMQSDLDPLTGRDEPRVDQTASVVQPPPPAPAPPPSVSPVPAPVDVCASSPVIKVTVPLKANQSLLCAVSGNANDIKLIDQDLDVLDARVKNYLPGRAIAYANLTFKNTNGSVTHFWASTLLVGNKSFNGIRGYRALGDDICPGGSRARAVIGAGGLTSTSRRLTLLAHSGANPCSNGSVHLVSGTVTVYIAKEACADRQMKLQSQLNQRPNGFVWPTTLYPMLTLAPVPDMRKGGTTVVMVAGEGSTPEFPGGPGNTCGAEVATVAWRLQASNVKLYSVSVPVPASMGMSHVVIGRMVSVPYTQIGSGNVELEVGRNFGTPVFTGAYSGTKTYNIGEAFLGLVHIK